MSSESDRGNQSWAILIDDGYYPQIDDLFIQNSDSNRNGHHVWYGWEVVSPSKVSIPY